MCYVTPFRVSMHADYTGNGCVGIYLVDHAPQARCLDLGGAKAQFLPKATFVGTP